MTNIGSGLVADYGSSTDSDTDCEIDREILKETRTEKCCINYFESVPDEQEKEISPKQTKKKESKKILANPLRNDNSVKSFLEPSSSVFYNPFKKEQEAKKSVLEKHVKLTNNPKDVVEINGKKICWNYRKGRCKFGHKCKYAHDSDLIGAYANNNKKTSSNDSYVSPVDSYGANETDRCKKRKPGLSEGLIPNKRSQKMYKDIQSKESPWLNKR